MITIRPVHIGEITAVKELLTHTWKDTYSCFMPEAIIQQVTETWHSPQNLQRQAEDPNTFFGVAENEEKRIVGLVTARQEGTAVQLFRLYVHPKEQGKGIGSQLLDAVGGRFPEAEKIMVEVEEKNTDSVGFYRAKGFVEVGKKDETIDDFTSVIIIMEKQLK